MELLNYTPFPALMTRFGASPDVMGASLVARVTYDLRDGIATPSDEQSWIVSPKPWECEYGPMEADEVFYKGGTDLFVFGSARTPRQRPLTEMIRRWDDRPAPVGLGSALRHTADACAPASPSARTGRCRRFIPVSTTPRFQRW